MLESKLAEEALAYVPQPEQEVPSPILQGAGPTQGGNNDETVTVGTVKDEMEPKAQTGWEAW